MKQIALGLLLLSSPALAAHGVGHHLHKSPARGVQHLHFASYQGGRIKAVMEGEAPMAPVMQNTYGVLSHMKPDANRERPDINAAIASPDFTCLKNEIIYEARGESDLGQVGVASVAHNRVSNVGATHCRVIYAVRNHLCQFDFVCTKHKTAITEESVRRAKTIALAILTGAIKDVTRGSTFFHVCKRGKSGGGFSFVMKIGAHCYYNETAKDVPKVRPKSESYHLVEDVRGVFGFRVVNDKTNKTAML